MEIRKYLRLVLRWWWLLIASTLIPMAISYVYTSTQPDYYQAKATLMVGASLFQDANPDAWQINLSNTLAAAYAELLKQGPVTEAVIQRLGLNRTPGQLAGQITARIYSGAKLLEIQVTDANPEAAALIANALADELVRGAPASGSSDPEQQEFIRGQLEDLQAKIDGLSGQISDLTATLSDLTSAAEIQEAQGRIAALEEAKTTYQTTYADLLNSYSAESPNVVTLFDPAEVPQWPLPSKRKLVVAMSGAAGLGLALGVIFLIEYLDTSLRWEGEGVQGILDLPVIGAIFQVPKGTRLVVGARSRGQGDGTGGDGYGAREPLKAAADSIRSMRANLFLLRSAGDGPAHRPFKTLLFTSPGDAEGKSFILANLALSLAAAGNRVIAVDADMRKPALHEFFDRPNVRGLAEALSDTGAGGAQGWAVPLQETGFPNLVLLSAGRPPADAAALLASPRLPALLEWLLGQGDVVLMDGPPVLGLPDAAILATLVEGTILVVGAGGTRRESLQQAKERLLRPSGVHLLGLVVNRVKPRPGSYHYGPALKGASAGLWSHVLERRSKVGDGTWLTLGEAAERLGISKEMARQWCKSGRLPAAWRMLRWQVERSALERLVQE